ncbi:MAG: SRPBCC family protein [Planctomycetales bacterium]
MITPFDASEASLPSPCEIHITRVVRAPRELVYRAWTDPEHLQHWWGPNGFTTTTYKMDFRPGGEWRFMMHGPDGRDYPNWIIYVEIVPNERLVYKHGGEVGHEDVNFSSTILFEDVGSDTKVTMQSIFPSEEERDRVIREYGAVEGGKQTLGRLAEYVERS